MGYGLPQPVTSVTGFAMTGFFQGERCKSRQADRDIRPYGGGKRRRGRDTWGPPYKFDFVRGDRRGRTPPLRITRGAVGRADVGIGPYGCIIIGAVVGRRPQGPSLRKGL